MDIDKLNLNPEKRQILEEMQMLVPAVKAIFDYGFIPTEDDIVEFTEEMYELAEKMEPQLTRPLYTIFPRDADIFETGINTLRKHEVKYMKQGIEFFANYKKLHGLSIESDELLLLIAARTLPIELSQDSQFKQEPISDEESDQRWKIFVSVADIDEEARKKFQPKESSQTPKMSYEEFKDYAIESLTKIFNKDNKDTVEIRVNVAHRNDETPYEAIHVWDKTKNVQRGNGFVVEPFYEDYCKGVPIGDIMLHIVKTLEESEDFVKNMDLDMKNFDKVKPKLMLRALSYDLNKKLLEDHVYKRFGDVAMVVYMLMKRDKSGLTTSKIPKKLLEDWELSEEELFDFAEENTLKLFKPMIMQAEAMLKGMMPQKYPDKNKFFMEPDFKLKKSMIGTYHVFADEGRNAATMLFIKGIPQKLAEILNDDFYLAMMEYTFVALHVKKKTPLRIIRQLIENDKKNPYINKDEFLTHNVYEYNRESGVLRMVPPDEE
ncbi:MAG: DUF5688 family protein [Defluviitaleaceae bacterium]|nr:DUF5688 family protein [Defluviitaleaceae bacterium]